MEMAIPCINFITGACSSVHNITNRTFAKAVISNTRRVNEEYEFVDKPFTDADSGYGDCTFRGQLQRVPLFDFFEVDLWILQ